MNMDIGWFAFVLALRGPLTELAHELYQLCHGDPERAKQVLRRIRDHGAVYEASQRDVDQRLEALRAREKDPPA